MLHYVEPFKDRYSNLYELLIEENVQLESFKDYQKRGLEYLISEGYLIVDRNDFVKIKDDVLIYLIGDLHREEVIGYWHYPKVIRDVLDEMASKNFVRFENTFLSTQEISYYNYFLNKKEFKNGLDIRNKYVHGTNKDSEKEHEFEYFILLKLIILILLKMEDDLTIKRNEE